MTQRYVTLYVGNLGNLKAQSDETFRCLQSRPENIQLCYLLLGGQALGEFGIDAVNWRYDHTRALQVKAHRSGNEAKVELLAVCDQQIAHIKLSSVP